MLREISKKKLIQRCSTRVGFRARDEIARGAPVCVAGRQSRQLAEDQRNLGSMGYLERDALSHGVPMDDIPCGANYPLWKPPGNYFPRGEAPPPYEEAVAAARAEQALLSMNPHALPQLNFSSGYLPAGNSHTTGVSLVGSGAQNAMNVTQASPLRETGAGTSPLISSSSSRPVSSPNIYAASYRQTSQPESASSGLSVGTSTTSFTMGTATYENLPAPLGIANLASQHSSGQQSSHAATSKVYQPHTTLPRQSGAFTISASLPNSSVNAHRTIPRTLTARTGTRLREMMTDRPASEFLRLPAAAVPSSPNFPHSTQQTALGTQEGPLSTSTFYESGPTQQPSSIAPAVTAAPSGSSTSTSTALPAPSSATVPAKQPERQPLDLKVEKPQNFKPSLNLANEINEEGSFESVACTCSMQALPTLHDDTDDYRSECENCKSATGSRYYLDNEDELVTSPHETMTLHRRPDETASSITPQYYRTSLTLPISTRQRTRSTGVRENWFSTMPQSSTESSDEN